MFWIALVLTLVVAVPASVDAQDCSEFFTLPKLGEWAEYRLSGKGVGPGARMRHAFVREEIRQGRKHARTEIDVGDKTNRMVLQMLVPANPYQPEALIEAVLKEGVQPAQRISGQGILAFWGFPLAKAMSEECKSMQLLNEETITVTAGTFKAFRYSVRKSDTKPGQQVWSSKAVPFGLVKTTNDDGTELELVGIGTGAQSVITETPVDVPRR